MSAPNAGRQSPDPENQTDNQQGKTAGGQVDAAPSSTHAADESNKTKESSSVLTSNPTDGPMEGVAEAKSSKDGRGPGI